MCFYCVLSLPSFFYFPCNFESMVFWCLCINMKTGTVETFSLWGGGEKTPQTLFVIGSHLRQTDCLYLPQTGVYELACSCPFLSTLSDCIHLHLTPQTGESICLCVRLHVCRLWCCASFDLNSYPTASNRVCRSSCADISGFENLSHSPSAS